ncbi:MAG TPA: AbrB/MazE/SpoVT family DNA-binding domain-containing protein [Chloroflexota bacterium]|nr:AbrB/MazE/SpoVT family DNA-binding domain-containing protein [Chloroflexota bacterium]
MNGKPAEYWAPEELGTASAPRLVGETTITSKNQVTLPARGLAAVGWERGDHILVEVIDEHMLLLVRRRADWVDAFAGQLSDVFGTHEETRAYLEQERQAWSTDHHEVR